MIRRNWNNSNEKTFKNTTPTPSSHNEEDTFLQPSYQQIDFQASWKIPRTHKTYISSQHSFTLQ